MRHHRDPGDTHALLCGVTRQGLSRRLWLAATLAVVCCLLAACAGERPVFFPPEPQRRPADLARPANALDAAAQREHLRLMSAFGGEYSAPAAKRAIDQIVAKLATVSGQANAAYQVTLLNSPVVNAFALPSGRLYLTRGLLALANDKAEIASVVAHEIAHVQARHAVERAELQQRSELVQRVVAQVLENQEVKNLITEDQEKNNNKKFLLQLKLKI